MQYFRATEYQFSKTEYAYSISYTKFYFLENVRILTYSILVYAYSLSVCTEIKQHI